MATTHKTGMTPKDFFLNLGALISLYILVPTLIILLFRIIDVAFPRVGSFSFTPSISFPVATVIVCFPIYIFISWLLGKSFILDPEKRNIVFKKWITYITLFITGVVIAGDLVTLIYTFLDGQIVSTGFALKILAVFVVAAAVFIYHIAELLNKLTVSRSRIAGSIATIAVIAVIILGFSVIGSPRTQRLMRYDQLKINDLQGIQYQITLYWQAKRRTSQFLFQISMIH